MRTAFLVVVALGMSVATDAGFYVDRRDPYGDALTRALVPASGCAVQLVALPSFTSEWSVCVVLDPQPQGGAKVEFRVLDPMLYGEMMRRILPPDPKVGETVSLDATAEARALASFTPSVRGRSAPLSRETATALGLLWRSALSRTRERPLGLDGVTYLAAVSTTAAQLGAWFAWSPKEGTPEDVFVNLGRRLAAYTEAPESERRTLEGGIRRDADALRSRFSP